MGHQTRQQAETGAKRPFSALSQYTSRTLSALTQQFKVISALNVVNRLFSALSQARGLFSALSHEERALSALSHAGRSVSARSHEERVLSALSRAGRLPLSVEALCTSGRCVTWHSRVST